MGFQVSTCPGCACGCGVLLEEVRGLLIAAHPVSQHPVSEGRLCIRGWNCAGSWRHPDRLTAPQIRQNGDLVPASIDDAVTRI
ncbi:MAG: formate dehydrogenase subunit alpha, partial [Acidobacteria bacterium]